MAVLSMAVLSIRSVYLSSILNYLNAAPPLAVLSMAVLSIAVVSLTVLSMAALSMAVSIAVLSTIQK